jgi:hypothetical protein
LGRCGEIRDLGEERFSGQYVPQLVREKAVEALRNRHVDLISRNHHNLYVGNAKGEDFVHLAQAGNNWTENRLVMAHGIRF